MIERALAHYGLPRARVLAEEPHRPNLIVRIDGARPGPHLALCGHLDTKPVGDAAAAVANRSLSTDDRGRPPLRTRLNRYEGRLRGDGPGRGGVRAGRRPGSLSLIFTADEEYGSHFGASYLVGHAHWRSTPSSSGSRPGCTRTGRRSGSSRAGSAASA